MTENGISGGPGSARLLALERIPIRTRESGVTLSAWCLSISSEEGEGNIVRLELSASEPLFRGQGIFLGWAQERLGAAYEALLPRDDSPAFEPQQLG